MEMSLHMRLHRELCRLKAWAFQEKHARKAEAIRADVQRAFTEHPSQTGETYFQHLWFTLGMALRLVSCAAVLLTHGLLPFLFTRTASAHIEAIYAIMKGRIPKARRDEIDIQRDI